MNDFDIVVVGAGAAGLIAGIFAGRAGKRVLLLDGSKRIGTKILISGGGRCNVTHEAVDRDDFNGNRNVIARILRTFPVPDTIAFFEDLGVMLKREPTGKLFPVTDQARTVLDALLLAAGQAGAEIRDETPVTRLERTSDGFLLNGSISASRVIIATGGKSIPKSGSDGSGYMLVEALGHTVTETFPALVPLLLEEGHWLLNLTGTSVDAALVLKSSSGKILQRIRGSVLFTHFGLSGPAVLDMSRHWIESRARGARLSISLLPDETFESLEEGATREAQQNHHATMSSSLRGLLPEKLIGALTGPRKALGKLTRDERRSVLHALVDLPLPVRGDRGFDFAEVTAGGVPLSEIDPSTMQSRRCEGLYLCGEILDVDGRIGGFNFQWAWAGGRLAGISAGS